MKTISKLLDLTADLCVPIKHANLWIALNVLMSATPLTALLIAKYPNPNVKPYAPNPFATGSVLNPSALNLSVNWFVKTPLADLKYIF